MKTGAYFTVERSAGYEKAASALAKLARAEGSGAVEQVFAEVIRPYRQAEEATRLARSGERPSSRTGLPGFLGRQASRAGELDESVFLGAGWLDHPRRYQRGRSPTTMVSEPYEMDLEALRRLVEVCDRYSLGCWISAGAATHYPGMTTAVVLTRARGGATDQ